MLSIYFSLFASINHLDGVICSYVLELIRLQVSATLIPRAIEYLETSIIESEIFFKKKLVICMNL